MNINNLPSLVISHLSQFFNINERLVLQKVNDDFKNKIEYRKDVLCLYFKKNDSFNRYWSFENQLINHKNSFQLTDHRLIDFKLLNLKKLSIILPDQFSANNYKLMSSLLSYRLLSQLNQLDFENYCLCEFDLRLPELKTLSLKNCCRSNLTIDTIKLEALTWYPKANCERRSIELDHLNEGRLNIGERLNARRLVELERRQNELRANEATKFNNEIQLKWLECASLSEVANLRFKQLKTLICSKFDDEIDLSELPALEHLQILKCDDNQIKELKFQKFNLRRVDLNLIFLNLLELQFKDPINFSSIDYYFISKKTANELIRSNYFPYKACLYYNDFEHLNSDQISRMFKKLRNVFKIEVFNTIDHQLDQEHLINFLHHCGSLEYLELYNTNLAQSFFDQFHHFSSIKYLEIKESKSWSIKNYEFLTYLNYLESIFIHYDGLAFELRHILDFAENAFANCKNLTKFVFGRRYFKAQIWKKTNKQFYLSIGPGNYNLPFDNSSFCLDAIISNLKLNQHELEKDFRIPILPVAVKSFF